MIGYLRGRLLRTTADGAVVEAGGVGYLVSLGAAARQKLGPVGSQVELHVHTHVREDQLALFGFASPEELDLFEDLIQVDGVGPKVGLAILSVASLEVLKRAILALPRAAGAAGDGAVPKAVEEALRGLGFSAVQTKAGLEAVDWSAQPTAQEALTIALKALGR